MSVASAPQMQKILAYLSLKIINCSTMSTKKKKILHESKLYDRSVVGNCVLLD